MKGIQRLGEKYKQSLVVGGRTRVRVKLPKYSLQGGDHSCLAAHAVLFDKEEKLLCIVLWQVLKQILPRRQLHKVHRVSVKAVQKLALCIAFWYVLGRPRHKIFPRHLGDHFELVKKLEQNRVGPIVVVAGLSVAGEML